MTQIAYVPHGVNSSDFRPIGETDPDFSEFTTFAEDFKQSNDVDFIVFWNNRNARRKAPGDVIMSYRLFCDKLPLEKSKKCALLMHTQIVDENGTDLLEVKKMVCPKYKVVFSDQPTHTKYINFFYNLADVTINIASNEGFGLSSAESIMAGTPVVNNTTGGLQDQMRFEDLKGNWISLSNMFTSNHKAKYTKTGKWAKPVFPASLSLQGSPMTPYIFDERTNPEDVADAIYSWWKLLPSTRSIRGIEGREWLLSEESGMSSIEMCSRMIKFIDTTLDTFIPRDRFELIKLTPETEITENQVGYSFK